jgi:hypothetical protein
VQPSAAPASATTSPEQEAQRAEQQAQYDAWTARLDEFANTYSNADIIAATNVTVTYPTANDYYVCGQYNPIEFNVVAPISFYLPEGVNATGYLGSFNADYTIARIIYPKSKLCVEYVCADANNIVGGNATFNPSTRSIVGVVNNYTLVTLPAFRVSECAMDNVVSFMVVNSSCMAVDSNFNLSCKLALADDGPR